MMSKKRSTKPIFVETISQNIFSILPLLKKRLLYIDIIQSEHDMPFSQIQVLSMLREKGSLSISEISSRLGIAKPNITPLVDKLIECRYVERTRDIQDRRVVNIIILEQGREKLAGIQKTICDQIWEWGKDMSVAEFRELSDSIESVIRILSKIHDHEDAVIE